MLDFTYAIAGQSPGQWLKPKVLAAALVFFHQQRHRLAMAKSKGFAAAFGVLHAIAGQSPGQWQETPAAAYGNAIAGQSPGQWQETPAAVCVNFIVILQI